MLDKRGQIPDDIRAQRDRLSDKSRGLADRLHKQTSHLGRCVRLFYIKSYNCKMLCNNYEQYFSLGSMWSDNFLLVWPVVADDCQVNDFLMYARTCDENYRGWPITALKGRRHIVV